MENLWIIYSAQWYWILSLSVLGGALGRLGGWEKGNRLFRLLGVPACACLLITLLGYAHWYLILCFGSILGASSTYFKAKNTPVRWFNWILVGFVESGALLPYAFFNHNWLGFAIRTIVCTALICLWDELIGWDVAEEAGRYFIIVATIPLLFI